MVKNPTWSYMELQGRVKRLSTYTGASDLGRCRIKNCILPHHISWRGTGLVDLLGGYNTTLTTLEHRKGCEDSYFSINFFWVVHIV